jgi:diacylglycerol kinase (ATP)
VPTAASWKEKKRVENVTQITDTARRVLIGVNPHAGAHNRQGIVAELRARLAAAGVEATVFQSIDALAAEAGRLLTAGELRGVVAAGGDGTVRMFAERTPPGTPLLVLPLGTENLLARYLELTTDPAQLARVILEGLAVRLDAGQAGDGLFTLMAGCGFDAEVVRRLHGARRGHIHHFSYARPILDAIREYDYPELRVSCTSVAADGRKPNDKSPRGGYSS